MRELSGILEGVGLPAIVRFLAGLKKTGSLELYEGDWRGSVEFDQGEITHAALGSSTGLAALEAMVELFPGAHFTFDATARTAVEPALRLDMDEILGTLDESVARCARGDHRLPSPDAVPSVQPGAEGDGEEALPLDRASLQTLLAVDGKRNVRQIVAERGSIDALWQLANLAEVGLVSMSARSARVVPEPPVTPAVMPPARASAVEQAPAHCPRLGFEDDPSSSFGRPTRLHRCFAGPTPLPLSVDQQRELCLSGQFEACPRLTPASRPAPGPASTPDARLRGVRPRAPQAESGRIVRLPTSEPANASGVDPTPIRPGAAAARSPMPLRARLERPPTTAPGMTATAQVPAGPAVAAAAPEVRREMPRPEPTVARPEEPRTPLTSRERLIKQRRRLVGIGIGAIALLALVLVGYVVLSQLSRDSTDTAQLPNASRIAAGTPVTDIAGVRVTPVPTTVVDSTSAQAARPTLAAPAAQPTVFPTVAVVPTSPAPRPSAAALFDERFTTNDANWPSDPQGVAQVTGGTYRIGTRQAAQFVAIGAPIANVPSDVVINASFRKLGGPAGGGYGIIVRSQDQGALNGTNQDGHYYVLEVGDKGEVGIWRRDGDHWVDLLPWQHADAVKTGSNGNDVSVRAVGDTLALSVNGTDVATRTDGTLTSGQAGLFVGGDGNQVAVTHFSIQSP